MKNRQSSPDSNTRRDLAEFPSPQNSQIKAVLFDCDGVVCPFLPFAKLLAKDYGITREMTADFFSSTFIPALRGQVEVLQILPPYLEKWGWKASAKDFLDTWLSTESYTRPDVVAMVQELRRTGYLVGLATNQESERAKYMRTHMGFEDLFDKCFISCELGAMKPEHDYYQKVTEQLGLSPNEIAFIDDQDNHLAKASSYGWRTILHENTVTTRTKLLDIFLANNS